jgi:hypothetical protein
MSDLIEALERQHACYGDCHRTLTLDQRTRAIEAIYHLDDALRGWGYDPIYAIDGDRQWREAQRRGDPGYMRVAVRFGECIHRRLVGAMIHEVLHAACGEAGLPNYGIPFGLPYGVPENVRELDEESYLAPYNFAEARAFVGVPIVARERFGLDWPVLNAREWGTYGFCGGNALVQVPAGFRAVAHVDAHHHHQRYMNLAKKIEDDARAWFAAGHFEITMRAIDAAAAKGASSRSARRPPAARMAAVRPEKRGRNDPCPCLSGKRVKACCGEKVAHTRDDAVPW